jgi:hypothetical protein
MVPKRGSSANFVAGRRHPTTEFASLKECPQPASFAGQRPSHLQPVLRAFGPAKADIASFAGRPRVLGCGSRHVRTTWVAARTVRDVSRDRGGDRSVTRAFERLDGSRPLPAGRTRGGRARFVIQAERERMKRQSAQHLIPQNVMSLPETPAGKHQAPLSIPPCLSGTIWGSRSPPWTTPRRGT